VRYGPTLLGKVLIIAGICLLAGWIYYFIQLERPIDRWDFCPIVVIVAAVLIGVKLVRRGEQTDLSTILKLN